MNNDLKPTVALIYGGRGAEAEVSLRGAERVLPLISRENYKPLAVFIDKDGRWLCGGGEVTPAFIGGLSGLYREGEMIPLSCAIPLLHGDFGEDGVVQGALENAKIPYAGCDTGAGAIACDKAATKALAESLSIPTLPFRVAVNTEGCIEAEEYLGYPLIVKPCTLGSSVGISVATNRDELTKATERALRLCPRVIIEKYLCAPRELECGYFSANCKEIFTDPGEISCDEGFYDYENKYQAGKTDEICPASLTEAEVAALESATRRGFEALRLRGYARFDFILDGDGTPWCLEANTLPGMTPTSLLPQAAAAVGISYDDLCERMVMMAVEHR